MIKFVYGSMKAGKTSALLDIYEKETLQGWDTDNIIVIRSAIDTRSAEGFVESRDGRHAYCWTVGQDSFWIDALRDLQPSMVLIDEAQFLSVPQIKHLVKMADDKGIDVIFFGLNTDYNGKVFSAAACLFNLADELEKLCASCDVCGEPAHFTHMDNAPSTDGLFIIGDKSFSPRCRQHFH